MPVTDSQTEHVSEIEAALLDAELFIKYNAPERAIKRLRTALEVNSRSIKLRERLREVCATHKQVEEAARQCLALASLYIEREDFDTAHDRLLAGDLTVISVFDAIQVIENARLNGILTLTESKRQGQVKFNDGRIVDAVCEGDVGDIGFQKVVEITSGTFEFQKTDEQFPSRIQAVSNTNPAVVELDL